VDLQEDRRFEALDVELLSISPDHLETWQQVEAEFGLQKPLLSDPKNAIANMYGVMKWRVPSHAPIESAEPGHTFVLVDEGGRVAWIRDYGAQENGGLMYVPPEQILREIEPLL
jgi:peroxiredoxin